MKYKDMDKRQRILSALRCEVPDRVPFMDSYIDRALQERLYGGCIDQPTVSGIHSWGIIATPGSMPDVRFQTLSVAPEVAQLLQYDAIGIDCLPPLFMQISVDEQGAAHIGKGLVRTEQDIEDIKLPDPDNEALYRPVLAFVEKYKDRFALYARIRLGISPVLNSMGLEYFSYMLYDAPKALRAFINIYTGWCGAVARNLSGMGLDFLWAFDDLASKDTTLISPSVFEEFFLQPVKKAAKNISIPWIFHSDGNLLPVLTMLLELGMNGLHPLEPGAMDLAALKSEYGKRICFIGNIDIDKTLSRGSEEDVEKEVKARIEQLGNGGGYICTSSNSLPAYVKLENVIAMSRAVQKYGRY